MHYYGIDEDIINMGYCFHQALGLNIILTVMNSVTALIT